MIPLNSLSVGKVVCTSGMSFTRGRSPSASAACSGGVESIAVCMFITYFYCSPVPCFWQRTRSTPLLELKTTNLFSISLASHPGLNLWLYGRICGSKWHSPAAAGRVRYAWRPAATRAGARKAVAAARPPAAEEFGRLRRQLSSEVDGYNHVVCC